MLKHLLRTRFVGTVLTNDNQQFISRTSAYAKRLRGIRCIRRKWGYVRMTSVVFQNWYVVSWHTGDIHTSSKQHGNGLCRAIQYLYNEHIVRCVPWIATCRTFFFKCMSRQQLCRLDTSNCGQIAHRRTIMVNDFPASSLLFNRAGYAAALHSTATLSGSQLFVEIAPFG